MTGNYDLKSASWKDRCLFEEEGGGFVSVESPYYCIYTDQTLLLTVRRTNDLQTIPKAGRSLLWEPRLFGYSTIQSYFDHVTWVNLESCRNTIKSIRVDVETYSLSS